MKAVIFDIDGTLLDSVDFHARAWREAFLRFGYDFSFHRVRSQIGKGGDQLLPEFLSKNQVREHGKEIEEFRGRLFRRHYLDRIKPFPQVRALFKRLKAEGWQLALASSAKKSELKIYQNMCRIGDLLDTKTSADDATKSKPYPDIFQAALHQLSGVQAQECVVVGDSPYDAQAAKKAGMKSIGVLSGGFPASRLRAAGFMALYQSPRDILKNFRESFSINKLDGEIGEG